MFVILEFLRPLSFFGAQPTRGQTTTSNLELLELELQTQTVFCFFSSGLSMSVRMRVCTGKAGGCLLVFGRARVWERNGEWLASGLYVKKRARVVWRPYCLEARHQA